MNSKKISGMIVGTAIIIVIGFTIYRALTGIGVGFNEIMGLAILFSIFFSAITWGTKGEDDGVRADEELGRKITEKSSKISYFVLMVLILIILLVDQFILGTMNTSLLIVLGLAFATLPCVEFLVARKYR